MIKTKQDYLNYLEMDRIALNVSKKRSRSAQIGSIVIGGVLNFQCLLRKIEYHQNCKKSIFSKIHNHWLCWKFHRAQLKYGFLIEPNCFGPGLSITHTGPIIVNSLARIGKNCRIYPGVVIGTKTLTADKAPKIGNNVYIGPGAKIFGDITIADGVAIGANSVVNKSFLEPNISIAGIPARKISNKGSKGLIIRANEKNKMQTATTKK